MCIANGPIKNNKVAIYVNATISQLNTPIFIFKMTFF